MRRPTLVLIALAICTSVGVAAASTARGTLPARAGTQQNAATSGHFTLSALPGRREWVVLDTENGQIQHWSASDEGYIIETIDSRTTAPRDRFRRDTLAYVRLIPAPK